MNNTDPLDEKLQQWKVMPTVPARFQADVWARIQQRDEVYQSSWKAILQGWLSPGVATWQLAAVTTLVMMIIGAGMGNLSAASVASKTRVDLVQGYVQSIDPYLHLAAESNK